MTIKMRIFLEKYKIRLAVAFAMFSLLVGGSFLAYNSLFGAPQKSAETELFTTPVLTVDKEDAIKRLKDGGFIHSSWAFNLVLSRTGKEIKPGGYKISKSMDSWKLAQTLTSTPSLKWVVIAEGLRKEEIGERLAKVLGWDEKQLHD